MLELEDISLDIVGSPRRILENINWTIGRGEKWILFGRNGSGKTKLLEIITGYTHPSEGNVKRFNFTEKGNDIRKIRKKIGYISNALNDKFYPHEKVINAVLSGLHATIGIYNDFNEIEMQRAMNLLDKMGLVHRSNDIISHLSFGEKQKVMIARAMMNEPELLIFDEPATGLDIVARENLLESLDSALSTSKASIIYVTHHIDEITSVFENIFMLKEGKSFYQGAVMEAVNSNVFSRLFGRDVEILRKNDRFYSFLS